MAARCGAVEVSAGRASADPTRQDVCGPASMTHDYKRHGTTTLFAALNMLDGTVIGRDMQRHRHELIRFLNAIDAEVPTGKAVHVILDTTPLTGTPKCVPGSPGSAGHGRTDRARNPQTSVRWASPRPGWAPACRRLFVVTGACAPPAFLAVEPIDAVDPRRLALASEQDEQPPIAEAPALIGEVAQPATQLRLRRSPRPIADHLAVGADDGAGPPLRQAHGGQQMRDGFALGGGPHHFFERTSRSAEASSIWSASSFFSFAFSSSSAFSRLASDTSIPPYSPSNYYSVNSVALLSYLR